MPTTRRDRTGRVPRSLRALTTVAALYALVLQALLGGIATLPVAQAPSLLCLQSAEDAEGEAEGEDGGGSARIVPHAACCTAAGHAPAAAPPPPSSLAAWASRVAAPPGWRRASAHAVRAPPHALASARAPPVA